MKAKLLRYISYWPPLFGAGIRVKNISSDFRALRVEMKLRFWNANYIGTHFGGSLFAMTDPFLMLMLTRNLGREYIIVDKSASIQFKKPGRGMVYAEFKLSTAEIESIKESADRDYKVEPHFKVLVLDEENEVVAEVEKKLYVRRKDKRPN